MTALWIMSDLHLEGERRLAHRDRFRPETILAHDVVVLAGDVHGEPAEAVRWAAERFSKPVVLIAGNHEFYGGALDVRLHAGKMAARETAGAVTHLENDVAVIAGVRFLGCTLWTDFELYPDRSRNMAAAARGMNDFSVIRAFSPTHARDRHLESVMWLASVLTEPHDGPTVVVTHHLPSRQSIADRFEGDPISPAFASDLEAMIERWQPELWIHGHVHDSFDYRIGGTRVVCNPKGYGGENADFRSDLVVEVGQ